MHQPADATQRLLARADRDSSFRTLLLADPKAALEQEFGVALAESHVIEVHEETDSATHLVLPPRSTRSEAERQAARTGVASLEFLKKTMHDPAPPLRSAPCSEHPQPAAAARASTQALAGEIRKSIRRGLNFLESAIDANGAWHCIRFNVADVSIPRHFEKPPFVSALCALALESSSEPRAKALFAASRKYIASTMEYPGLWRYYRHLPQDLDSTALCSLAIGNHPWILLDRNVARMVANRDDAGRFTTWILEAGEPDVVSSFRTESDPVVNANVIAYLGDRPETRPAQKWLEELIVEDRLAGASKWYPDAVSVYYAASRALSRAQPALERLRPVLAECILGLRGESGEFGNLLQSAQAVSALYGIGGIRRIDASRAAQHFLAAQREDGSWPELLAFGDQSRKWGLIGRIGHGSESITSALCIEALERLAETLERR